MSEIIEEELIEYHVFSSEEQLIEYFKNDLARQREKYKIEHGIEAPDSKLTLGISDMKIDCDFNFYHILRALDTTKRDKNRSIIYPYNIDLYHTVFSQDVFFGSITFIQDVDFQDIIFNQDVFFNDVTFLQSVNFRDTTFSQNVEFWPTTFNQNISFNDITFEKKIWFFDIHFKQKVIFDNIKMNTDRSSIVFDNIYYDYNNKNTIAITNTVINGRIDFDDVHIAKLNLEGSNVTGILNRINLKAKSENWETACILKNEELKRNNTIKALEYHAEEKDLHMKELRKDKKIVDLMSLMLSKIVNNHGQNWFQALCFTLSVPIFAYTLFSLPNDLFVPILLWEVLLVAVVSFIAFFKPVSKLSEKINFKDWFTYFCRKEPILKKHLIALYKFLFNTQTLLCVFYISSIGILFYLGIEPINLGIHLEGLIDYFVPTNYDPLKSYVKNVSNYGYLITIRGVIIYMIGKIALPYGIYEVYKAFRKYR